MNHLNHIKNMPIALGMVKVGSLVKVVDIIGGKNLLKRLLAMGLMEDTQLQVLHQQKGTGVVIACGETRLAVGVGMASQILVVPI